MLDDQRAVYNDRIRVLLTELDAHSPGEAAHAERVAVYSVAVGEAMGLSDDDLVHLGWAAKLHDVGKIRVDANLIAKLGSLSEEEFEALRAHALHAQEVLSGMLWLAPAEGMIRHHHEWWNGEGYPEGLARKEIPLGARIIGAAEAFDVLISDVPWRDRLTATLALEEMRRCRGSQFDPTVVDTLADVHDLIQPVRGEPLG